MTMYAEKTLRQVIRSHLPTENLITASLKKRIEAKVADFDVKGAVRLLCSD